MSIYINDQKRHWRYWTWKRIKNHCQTIASRATVFFLAGPSPLDLEAAEKNGFNRKNIVAVDLDEECVKAARRSGCTAIQGSLLEIVERWDGGSIDGLIADYTCGLSWKTFEESHKILAHVDGACCFNFQRGRETDHRSHVLRAEARRISLCNKHRGEMFVASTKLLICGQLNGIHLDRTNDGESFVNACRTVSSLYSTEVASLISSLWCSYETFEYKSNVVKMDSVCGTLRFSGIPSVHEAITSNNLAIDSLRGRLIDIKEQRIAILNEQIEAIMRCVVELHGLCGYDPILDSAISQVNELNTERLAILKEIRDDRNSCSSVRQIRSRIVAAKAVRTMRGATRQEGR